MPIRREVIILADYHEGIDLLATAWATTPDAVVNSLVYRGLREHLTDETLDRALAKRRVTVKTKLRLGEQSE
jgi:hypothetical protein